MAIFMDINGPFILCVVAAAPQVELGLLENDLGVMELETVELRAAAAEKDDALAALHAQLAERDNQARNYSAQA